MNKVLIALNSRSQEANQYAHNRIFARSLKLIAKNVKNNEKNWKQKWNSPVTFKDLIENQFNTIALLTETILQGTIFIKPKRPDYNGRPDRPTK